MELEPNLNPEVSALLVKLGIPTVIRAINAYGNQEYERRSREHYERMQRDFPDIDWDEDGWPARLRQERHEPFAFLLGIDNVADRFEEKMAQSGWTRKQHCEAERAKELAETEAKLESLRKRQCA